MFEQNNFATIGRNAVVYIAGVALAVAGVLGFAEVVEISPVVSGLLLLVGLVLVVSVHEYFGGLL